MIPEDRKELGLLLSQSLKTNMTLGSLYRFSGKAGWIRQKEEEACAEQYRVDLAVQCDTIEQKANELSGGNQQKVVLARWLLRDCPILLFDEPTKGIDVAARAKIHSMLLDLAADGKAIVVVSSDSQELMAICDRITVLSAGVSVATFVRGEWSSELLLEAAFSEYAGGRAVG